MSALLQKASQQSKDLLALLDQAAAAASSLYEAHNRVLHWAIGSAEFNENETLGQNITLLVSEDADFEVERVVCYYDYATVSKNDAADAESLSSVVYLPLLGGSQFDAFIEMSWNIAGRTFSYQNAPFPVRQLFSLNSELSRRDIPRSRNYQLTPSGLPFKLLLPRGSSFTARVTPSFALANGGSIAYRYRATVVLEGVKLS